MSREIGFLNDFRSDDFGFGKGQDFLIFVRTSDLRFLDPSYHIRQNNAKLPEQYMHLFIISLLFPCLPWSNRSHRLKV